MARAQPLYTLEEQYAKLDLDLPSRYMSLNILRFRLLVACSNQGSLDSAKNRLLNLIQDTEIKAIFSSILEVPELKETEGVSSINNIYKKFEGNLRYFPSALSELSILGVPLQTRDLFEQYFEGNLDPVYKLSVVASMIMMAYIKDDQINNRKE